MKAAIIRSFGPPNVLEYADVPDPLPRPHHVVVRVLACGINRYDTYLRLGAITPDLKFPHVMGADIAGEIHALGQGVEGWTVGERVIVAPGYPTDPAEWSFQPENFASSFAVAGTVSWGGYAQFAEAPAPFLIRDDFGFPPPQMACVPLVLVTAIHAVRTLGRASEVKTVLVQAGASGSGNMCIQVAKALGAKVATTVGVDEKFRVAQAAGADLVINYRESEFMQRVLDWTAGRGVDLVIDNVGGDVLSQSLTCLRPGGILVNFGAVGGTTSKLNVLDLLFRQLTIHGSKMGSMEELRFGLELLKGGRLKPALDRTFPLRLAHEAHDLMEKRQVRGKFVLLPWDS